MPHEHDFDPISGWCTRCNLRDDNRLVVNGNEWRAGPEYTTDQLNNFLQKGLTK